jgi:hypothetical protein
MYVIAKRASVLLYNFIKTFPQGTYLIPANVCPIVPITFCLAKVPFEFVDLNEKTFCIDEQKCLEMISSNIQKYCGIVFVRTYGYKYDASFFFDTLHSLNKEFRIIDDRCLSIPELNTKAEKSDLILYSTGHKKPVNLGIGGIGILNDLISINKYNEFFSSEVDIEKILKDSLERKSFLKDVPSGWLDTGGFSLGIIDYMNKINLEKINIIKHKDRLNDIYLNLLPSEVIMPQAFHEWRFNILVDNKEFLLKKIFENNLFASSHYLPSNLLFNDGHFTIAEDLHKRIINLFNDSFISEQQVEMICKIINKYL